MKQHLLWGSSTNKVNVVFGDSAKAVHEFARTAATSLGQSQQQALEAAGTYGNLLTSIGVIPEVAADMSISLVKLASDLASFNNASPEETLLALRSALTGEFEPMKRFGAALSADAVAAQALAMGLAKTKEELTPAIKAQATYALILEQTTNAQGDFARTSDGLANQQRILAAQMTDLKARVGEALLPAMSALVTIATAQLLPALTTLAQDTLPQIVPVITEIGVAAVKWISETLIPAFLQAVEWMRGNWPQIQATIADVWAQIQPVFTAINEYVQSVVIPALSDAVEWVITNWPQIQATIHQVMTQVQQVIQTVLAAVQAFWAQWGDEIMAIVNVFVQQYQTLFAAFAAAFSGDWRRFGELLREAFDRAWEEIIAIATKAVQWFVSQDWGEIGSNIVRGIAAGISAGAQWVADAAMAAARAALDAARGFLGIRSPSQVFAAIGEQMMAGMALGVERQQLLPARATAQAGMLAAQSIYMGGVSININGAQQPDAIARAVRAELERVSRYADARLRMR